MWGLYDQIKRLSQENAVLMLHISTGKRAEFWKKLYVEARSLLTTTQEKAAFLQDELHDYAKQCADLRKDVDKWVLTALNNANRFAKDQGELALENERLRTALERAVGALESATPEPVNKFYTNWGVKVNYNGRWMMVQDAMKAARRELSPPQPHPPASSSST